MGPGVSAVEKVGERSFRFQGPAPDLQLERCFVLPVTEKFKGRPAVREGDTPYRSHHKSFGYHPCYLLYMFTYCVLVSARVVFKRNQNPVQGCKKRMG